ncbi:hypothetical protein AVEN_70316-1, partial [Araneus ventricosus]
GVICFNEGEGIIFNRNVIMAVIEIFLGVSSADNEEGLNDAESKNPEADDVST